MGPNAAMIVSALLVLGSVVPRAVAASVPLDRHDIEDLLAAGFSAATIETLVGETGRTVILSESDLGELRSEGVSDETLSFLRNRATIPAPALAGGEVSPSTPSPGAYAGTPYASSNLGPCLCGNDPVCVEYCLYFSSGNRALPTGPLFFFGGGHFNHHLGSFGAIHHDHPGHHPGDQHATGGFGGHGASVGFGHGHSTGHAGHGGHGGHGGGHGGGH